MEVRKLRSHVGWCTWLLGRMLRKLQLPLWLSGRSRWWTASFTKSPSQGCAQHITLDIFLSSTIISNSSTEYTWTPFFWIIPFVSPYLTLKLGWIFISCLHRLYNLCCLQSPCGRHYLVAISLKHIFRHLYDYGFSEHIFRHWYEYSYKSLVLCDRGSRYLVHIGFSEHIFRHWYEYSYKSLVLCDRGSRYLVHIGDVWSQIIEASESPRAIQKPGHW